MKVRLLYRQQDFINDHELPWQSKQLVQDLELPTLFTAMAGKDDYIYDLVKSVILKSLKSDTDSIIYRQNILKDCLRNPDIVKSIYQISVQALEDKKGHYYGIFNKYPKSKMSDSVDILLYFEAKLDELSNLCSTYSTRFSAEGFKAFFSMINNELSPAYLSQVKMLLKELKSRNSLLFSAELGKGNAGVNYTFRKSREIRKNWLQRLFSSDSSAYTIVIPDRDDSGFRALSDIENNGLAKTAFILEQSAQHIENFFKTLRTELSFFIGCLNLHEQLNKLHHKVCFPVPAESAIRQFSFTGLYDVCLALTTQKPVVGNQLQADKTGLVIITGANQGGKSVFLRSIGLAQLMLQSGMFVPADSYAAELFDGVFTHYIRQEDTQMKSGKLDEELGRMSEIIDHITTHPLLLFNESFSATNEREGSEVARQITDPLMEKQCRIFYVTHMYEYARSYYQAKNPHTLFLRAERNSQGIRTFKLLVGEPLQTSFGKDLYQIIFSPETNTDN